jgi:hypothetical protein
MGEVGLEWPEGRPRRVYASVDSMRVRVLCCSDDVVDMVAVLARWGVWRIMRAVPLRISAMSSSSRLSGRGGRGGAGPAGLVKGMVVGSEFVGVWIACPDDSGREIEMIRSGSDRGAREKRVDSNGLSVGWCGFGVGMSMGSWGIGGGGAS